MGCGISAKKDLRVIYTPTQKNISTNSKKSLTKRKANAIVSQSSWLNIIDYLNFIDIKEVGKTNRMFNYLVRQNQVLVKFFKRKTTTRKYINEAHCKAALETFANLQKMKSAIFFNDSVFSTSIGDNEQL